MKVFVCIPSFNEADNICNITALVDQGIALLNQRYANMQASIVNCDSASTDSTVASFLSTRTKAPKISLRESQPGKGRNLLAFIELAQAQNADACLTVDADITSATPQWITSLAEPILTGRAEFVTPSYERSRFEGSTTNNFAYPTLLAFTGAPIRQPIGGDFAFGRRAIELLRDHPAPRGAYAYGIDIFLTYISAAAGLTIEQVELGKKLHSPSFHKLELMFPQIASTAAWLVRNIRPQSISMVTQPQGVGITQQLKRTSAEAVEKMYERTIKRLHRSDWLPEIGLDLVERALSGQRVTATESTWVTILAAWFEAVQGCDEDRIEPLACELLPLFTLRAITFWDTAALLTAPQVEAAIDHQAKAFQDTVARSRDTATTSAPAALSSRN